MSIRDDVADLRRYLIELRVLLFDQGGGGGAGGKVIDSPAPWNTPVGELLTDIHAGARRMAREWSDLTGRPVPAMGAVDAGTMKALDFVGTSVEMLHSRHCGGTYIEAAEREVSAWARRCRVELGIMRAGDEPWSRVPDLRCPNEGCGASLFFAPGWQYDPAPGVSCLACRTAQGGPTTWAYGEWHPLVATVA